MDQDTDYRSLGLVFLGLGASMCFTMWFFFGPAFAASGLAFVILGAVFLSKSEDDEA